jgi:hypothetical protein
MRTVLAIFVIMCGIGVAKGQQVVPFHATRNGLPGIEVTVNGTKVQGILDSGTGGIVISKRLATTMGIKLGRSPIKASGGGRGPQRLFPVQLEMVTLGQTGLHNVSAFATDMKYLSENAGYPIDILLRYPLFAQYAVTIDYPDQRISVYGKNSAPRCPAPIPLTFFGGVPLVTAKAVLPKAHLVQTVHLVVDLGTAKAAVMFGKAFSNTKMGRMLAGHKQSRVGGNGLGGQVRAVDARLPELRVGEQRFHDLKIGLTKDVKVFNGEHVDGSLGSLLWRSGSITFNYPNHTLCIQPRHG